LVPVASLLLAIRKLLGETAMTEMNRRDYLKRLGLTSAVVMGTNHLASLRTIASTSNDDDSQRLSGNYDSSNPKEANTVEALVGNWPTGSKPDPSVFGVKLIFAGMCIFGYKGNEAHVVFHRGNTNMHKMKIIVSEKGTECTDIYSISDGSQPADIRTLEVGIKSKPSNVNFFLGADFKREDNIGDELDFRWLIDLEGRDGYMKELRKTDQKFSAKMKVKHGTLYTYQRTNATFDAQNGPFSGRHFGHIAKIMAANIPRLSDGESVYLDINGVNVLPYPLTNRGQYEIYFFNEPETATDNDFDMVFDAFQLAPREKFKLVRVTRGSEESTRGLCHDLPLEKKVTDEAPCMGGAFSSGKGFP
jgi:hypothetical protein